jgi:hypothetical protein
MRRKALCRVGGWLQRMAGFGIDETEAVWLVARLEQRDADGDDRGSCGEYSHWTG